MSKDKSYLKFLKSVKGLVEKEIKEETKLTTKEQSDILKKQIVEHFSKEDIFIVGYSTTRELQRLGFGPDGYAKLVPGDSIHITINTTKQC